jgi:hypothetical protein
MVTLERVDLFDYLDLLAFHECYESLALSLVFI